MTNNHLSFEIKYEGKEQEKLIINTTPKAKLNLVKTYGGESKNSNLLIYGDNLPALRTLLDNPNVGGKVKLIYIDPPFATNQAFQGKKLQPAYKDELSGAAYLEFMRKRLILLREILSNDGSIYVHLDNNMAFPIKIIMDEIFGEKNFRNWIVRKKSNQKNYTRKSYGNIQDFMLFYTKSDKYTWNRPYKEYEIYSLAERFPKTDKNTGERYALVPIHAPGIRNGETGKLWKGIKPPPGKHWMFSPSKLDEFDQKGEIYWSPTGNPRRKIFAKHNKGVPVQDIWLEFKDAHNQNIEITGYPTEKNPGILERIIETSSNEGDIILDCFLGSGTTAAVAEQLGRKWIGIDNSKLAVYISLRRLIKNNLATKQLPLENYEKRFDQLNFQLFASENDPMVENGNYTPRVDIDLTIRNREELSIEVNSFSSTDPAAKSQKIKGLDLLGLLVVDTNLTGKEFSIHQAYVGELQTLRRLKVNIMKETKKIRIGVYDIYGNEYLFEKVVKEFSTAYPVFTQPNI